MKDREGILRHGRRLYTMYEVKVYRARKAAYVALYVAHKSNPDTSSDEFLLLVEDILKE